MNPSRPFILRPVATALLMVAMFLAGAVAFLQIPVSALPEVDYPTIQVLTFYPGASPTVVASAVTAPLERQFGQVAGLSQMTSTSAGGISVIVLQFQLSLNIDVAEQEVQAAINAAQSYLPANLPTPPVYSKSNPADAPVLTLALTSSELPLSHVQDLADTRLAPKISQIAGVGLVSISGGQKPAVRIQAKPTVLASYGINLEDLRNALVANSLNAAKGSFDGPAKNYTINANDQLPTSESYNAVVVAYRNGAPVMLNEVARVIDGVEDTRLAAWSNETPAILLNIRRQPAANTIQVVESIEKLLPTIEATLPRAVHVQIVSDRTTAIRASVEDVEFELMLTVALVVMVIFLFLRSLKATIIPSIAVPLSLVGTFAVMYFAGFSLNNLTMMALTISTGFVVDDAIVMIENISRFIEEGERPLAAALKGAEQIGFTILSLTVSLIAVLIPLLFMGNVAGRLFREFAVTLAVTIVLSAVVSLTLTPMMSARLLRYTPPERQGRFYRLSERGFDRVIAFYGRTLRFVLDYQAVTLLVAVGVMILTVLLYILVPKGFFPTQDTGIIQGISQAAASISFTSMSERQQALVKVVLADPAVAQVSSFIGADGTNTTLNSGRIEIDLKPLRERRINASAVIARLAPKLASVPGIRLYMQPVQDLTVADRVTATQYQYTLEDPSQPVLEGAVQGLLPKLRQLPQLADVTTDQQLGGVAEAVTIDRPTASRFGITPQMISNTLYDAFGQRQVNTLFTDVNQYHVILEADPEYQIDPGSLHDVYIQSSLTPGATASPAAPNTAGSSFGAGSGAATPTGTTLLTPTFTSGLGSTPPPTSAVTSAGALVVPGSSTANATSPLSPAAARVYTATVLSSASTTATAANGTGSVLAAAAPGTFVGVGGTGPAGVAATAATSASGSSGGVATTSSGAAAPLQTPVPLDAFTHMERRSAPLAVNRQGQFPAVTVSFNLAPGHSLGQAIDAMDGVLARHKLPSSVVANYQGTAAAFANSRSNQALLILAALVTVYIVLGVLYESFVHPITILSTLPSAGVGALLALLIFHLDLDVVAIIGIILLIGIVKKNGIMMVDFALDAQRNEGRTATEAIYQASLLRFRPILMTTMAALLSGLPLAFGTGIGSELRRPLGVAMVGGLLVSQVLTLYTTPVIYIFFDNLGARIGRWRRRR
jgi:multidrug efflux pump